MQTAVLPKALVPPGALITSRPVIEHNRSIKPQIHENVLADIWSADPEFIVIDEFCGFGGTTTGFHKTEGKAIVIACINHDHKAIKSHWMNYPDVEHFNEDITKMYGHIFFCPDGHGILFESAEFRRLKRMVDIYRAFYPNAKLVLWASLECTNFSKAKGGLARDADSRALAEHLIRYVIPLEPDFIKIENVVEFMAWGPMLNGKPISSKNGESWMRWRKSLCDIGYHDDWKEMNSADFGAYTSRNRLFGCFAKGKLPIVFPRPTHAKKVKQTDIFQNMLKPWAAVRDVLHLEEEGKSIFINLFERSRKNSKLWLKKVNKTEDLDKKIVVFPSSTIEPHIAMPVKLIIGKQDKDNFDALITEFCLKNQLAENEISFYLYDPYAEKTFERVYAGCIKFIAMGDTSFLTKYYSGAPEHKVISINGPTATLRTTDCQSLVQTEFILKYNSTQKDGKVSSGHSVNGPAPVVSTQNRLSLVKTEFLVNYQHSSNSNSLDTACPTLTTRDKYGLVHPKFLSVFNGCISTAMGSLNKPCKVLGTKDRFSLVSPVQFIKRDFSNGGESSSIDAPAGSIMRRPKMDLITVRQFLKIQMGKSGAQSLDNPAGAIMPNPKWNLISLRPAPFIMDTNFDNKPRSIEGPAGTITANRKHSYIVNPSYYGNPHSIDVPCPVIVARQDKAPLYLVNAITGEVCIPLYETDSPMIVKIKQFMAAYGIIDIKMRMLMVPELLKIQGFDENYQWEGNQSDAKKFIGNSVVPHVVTAWCEAMSEACFPKIQEAA